MPRIEGHPCFCDGMIVIQLAYNEARGPITDAVRSIVREISDVSELEVRKLLPALPQHIDLVVVSGKRVIPQTGFAGVALASGRVVFTIDPDRQEGATAIIRGHLRSVLHHEFHHLARGWVVHGGSPRASLIDAVICEGLATAFERDFAGSRPPWGNYPDDVAAWVDEILALPASATYSQWMFRHPDGRSWIGYRAGTYIADQAKQRTGLTSADLVRTPHDEVLALADIGLPRATQV